MPFLEYTDNSLYIKNSLIPFFNISILGTFLFDWDTKKWDTFWVPILINFGSPFWIDLGVPILDQKNPDSNGDWGSKSGSKNRPKWIPKMIQNGDPKSTKNGDPKSIKMGTQKSIKMGTQKSIQNRSKLLDPEMSDSGYFCHS